MRGPGFFSGMVIFCFSAMVMIASSYSAQPAGPSESMIKEAYRSVLSSLDANKDGKLSVSECMAMSKDKKKAEKDCKYWDENGDGTITEEEYVRQVKKMMR
jgi:Ca2+-binding EF-hand superfamily protein